MVDQTEEGRVGTNAASERDHGDEKDTGPSKERPKAIGHIAREHGSKTLQQLILDSEIIRKSLRIQTMVWDDAVVLLNASKRRALDSKNCPNKQPGYRATWQGWFPAIPPLSSSTL
jgi:hypothetical protein